MVSALNGMQHRHRFLCLLTAALTGGALALVGAPAPPQHSASPVATDEAPAPRWFAPFLTDTTATADPTTPAAPAAEPKPRPIRDAAGSTPELPRQVRVSWSPTAKRLLAAGARAALEGQGVHVRAMTESDRGVRGRVVRGDDDIGVLAGAATDDERAQGLHSRVLGYHVLAAIVHERNPLRDLPRYLLHAAVVGSASEWSHLGANRAGPVQLVTVTQDPFTDQASSLIVLGDQVAATAVRLASDEDVRRYVAEHEGALGVCGLAAVERVPSGVRVLTIDAVAPSATAFVAGRYPFASPVRVLAREARRCTWLGDEPGTGVLSMVAEPVTSTGRRRP